MVSAVVSLLMMVLAITASLTYAKFSRPFESETLAIAVGAIDSVLLGVSRHSCSVMLLTDGSTSPSTISKVKGRLHAPWGVAVFEAAAADRESNGTQAQLSRVVGQARRLRQLSWCVTVVVVSDDPAFLAAFAEWSLKGRLLVWSTRLLVVTRLPLPELQDLHGVLSSRNAMLLLVQDTPQSPRCSVYVYHPYSPWGSHGFLVASWTPHWGLSLTTHLPLFPDKFSKFLVAPDLVVSVIVMANHNAEVIHDPEAPGGRRLLYAGPIANVVEYLSRGLNFTYTYVIPHDRTFGTRGINGSWTGMLGMVKRKEADIAIGPFSITSTRFEAVDFSWPLWYDSSRILASRGRPEVDPWGFLLPLAPLVWVTILTALVVVPAVTSLLSSCFLLEASSWSGWLSDTYRLFCILLQQTVSVAADWWSWERLVLGVWMMMTLVLTRSYSGNLMSLLAVRHIPQPFQTLREVIEEPSTVMIWQSNSINAEYLRVVESGIIREVADLESEGRVLYRTQREYRSILDRLVVAGHHVLIDVDITLRNLMAKDFTQKGDCVFYTSRESILPFSSSIISQKDNPILPAMRKRVIALTESGIFEQWFKTSVPNSTQCLHAPRKITVQTSLSLTNLWGMFVALAAGNIFALLTLCLEMVRPPVTQTGWSSMRNSCGK
ncbi:probable glutamate receptor [Panulirus ornatus]|uniref:probable glutamate receptor n=1 Tax=Panulirus ornatus TaxID=150431 RepID=UPI003A8A6945